MARPDSSLARARLITIFNLALALMAPPAVARGLAHDADVHALVQRSLAELERARLGQDAAAAGRAAEAARAALAADPDEPEALAAESACRAHRHEFAAALEAAERALAKRPSNALALAIRVDALTELGRYDEALSACDAMLEARPGPAAFARASYQCRLRGDHDGAIAHLDAALEASTSAGERAWCLAHRAEERAVRAQDGDLGRAMSDVRHALELAPGNRASELLEIRLLAAAEGASTAIERANALLVVRADDADLHFLLAQLSIGAGRAENAAQHLDAAERLERGELAAGGTELHHLIDVLLLRGDRVAEALALVERESAGRSDVFTSDRLALARLASGDVEGAGAAMERALRTGCDDPSLLVHAGQVAAAAEDRATAERRFAAALERSAGLLPHELEIARRGR